MKIKTKKQLNLPQLIEWIEKNRRFDESFGSDRYNYVHANIDGILEFTGNFCEDTFTVEVEEEIREDTEVPTLVMFYENHNFKKVCRFEDNVSISDFQFYEHEVVLAYYILNDDLTMTLIWRDGKLVE